MKRIGFVGFSGSGKSSLMNIAGSAGFRTVDTDAAILSKYGTGPFDAILNGNEEGFRCVESETISYCIKSDAQIFAFGGGFHYG
ncbi:MAG TPA: shikimate kinase, partial [bacterium]|nr:shikimate kinase [bacterium]